MTRIFYSKDNADRLDEIRRATVDTIIGLMDAVGAAAGVDTRGCISMAAAGNTTMIHFLLGLDAFCVFSSPYAVRSDRPGFIRGSELDIPIKGYVYCFPSKANYMGGDVISGIAATGMNRRADISLLFDVGTNGELVVGNRDFLLCGAGAAGPALEGGVVKTGMRAAAGAVQHVKLRDGAFDLDVIGKGEAKGICGSGIIDLISELFINGCLDIRGVIDESGKELTVSRFGEGGAAVMYAPGLWFYQSDIDEFIRTKAAAYTMMEILLSEAGMSIEDVHDFYMAGAFGTHVDIESAINIGMYPDVDPSKIHGAGNTSLEGAAMLLTDRSMLDELPRILDLMSYAQFGAVENFLERMNAARALPHTDMERYPSVRARLLKHKTDERSS